MKYIKLPLYISQKNIRAHEILLTIPARDRSDWICNLIIAAGSEGTEKVKAALRAALQQVEKEE